MNILLPLNISFWYLFFRFTYYLNRKRLEKYSIKEVEARNYTSYLNSLIHACLSIVYSSFALYMDYDKIPNFESASIWFQLLAPITLGYFVQDFLHMITVMLKEKLVLENISFMIHHIAFFSVIYTLLEINKYHLITCLTMYVEISTVFINIYQYLKYYAKLYSKKESPLAKKYNDTAHYIFIITLVTFFSFRIVGIAVLTIVYYNQIWEYNYIFFFVAAFVLVLNFVWFFQMTKIVKNYRPIC